jgi:hypothetical protein
MEAARDDAGQVNRTTQIKFNILLNAPTLPPRENELIARENSGNQGYSYLTPSVWTLTNDSVPRARARGWLPGFSEGLHPRHWNDRK